MRATEEISPCVFLCQGMRSATEGYWMEKSVLSAEHFDEWEGECYEI